MTDAINTNNRPRNAAVPTEARGSTQANNASAASNSAAATSAKDNQSNPAAIVELSTSGLLQSIGEQIEKLPEVNEAKVASIKQSLAQGDYKADAEVIARKFSEIEKLLP